MGQKILVVDDDHLITKGLDILLTNAGYQTKAIHAGDEVVDTVSAFRPDLILLDVMLGGTDGRDIARSLKEASATKAIPIILISANHYMQRDYESHGACAFIPKPFDSMSLLKTIGKYCP